MDNVDFSEGLPKEANPFVKYGLMFKSDGSIDGPRRPPLYSETPPIAIEGDALDLSPHRSFLEKIMKGDTFSATEEQAELMGIVDSVFTAVTNSNLSDYQRTIFMDGPDWVKFKAKLQSNNDEGKSYDAINLGGLVILGAEGTNKMLPLLFHETGHSLYPYQEDHFRGELQAYYFQRVSTALLQTQLKQIGLHYSYPDYDDESIFPSKDHRDAYQAAATLYTYQSLPEELVEKLEIVNPSEYQQMQELLSIVKPARI